MRVLVCGDRNWKNIGAIKREMLNFEDGTIIIHGCAKGADILAAHVADELGFEIIPFNADWNTYGKAAGPIRNKQMLVEGKPDFVLAFHTDISKSKGTKHMMEIARNAGINTKLVIM